MHPRSQASGRSVGSKRKHHNRCWHPVHRVWARGRKYFPGEQILKTGKSLLKIRYDLGTKELGKDKKLSQRIEAGAKLQRNHNVTGTAWEWQGAGPNQFLAPSNSATGRQGWDGIDLPAEVTSVAVFRGSTIRQLLNHPAIET